MEKERPSRRLAAVMLADLVGYSRMVAEDEAGTLARVEAMMARVARPAVARHGGRTVKGTGDGFLAEFPSAVEAVACAAAIQQALAEAARTTPPGRRLLLRIGVNLGDIIAGADGDIYGDGVNLAARLEPLAEPGGIAISAKVHAEVRGRLPLAWADGGERVLKNIPEPVRVFLHAPGTKTAATASAARARLAVLPFSGPASLAPGLAWLAAGAVARGRRLAVPATAEAEALARDPRSPRSAAAAAGLRAVLEGEVIEEPGGIRFDGLLYDPRSGEHLLALREEATGETLASLPGRLAAAIARRAHEPEPLAEFLPTRRPRAFLALLQGLGTSDPDAAIPALEEAVAEDPACALGHAALAHAFSSRAAIDPGALRDAEALATRALSLDPADGRTLALAAAALARAGSEHAGPTARLAAACEGDGEVAAILASAGLAAA